MRTRRGDHGNHRPTTSGRSVAHVTNELVGRDGFDDSLKSEARTKDATWVIRQRKDFDASGAPVMREVAVYSALAKDDGKLRLSDGGRGALPDPHLVQGQLPPLPARRCRRPGAARGDLPAVRRLRGLWPLPLTWLIPASIRPGGSCARRAETDERLAQARICSRRGRRPPAGRRSGRRNTAGSLLTEPLGRFRWS